MAERLKEQINPQHLPLSTRRADAIHAARTRAHPPASPHYAGHDAGLHGEDVPYTTRVRPRRPFSPPPQEDDEDDEDDAALYPQRPPRSAIRYTSETVPRSHKTRVVYAPAKETVRFRRPRFHWLFWMGLALLVMLAGFLAFSTLGSWWQVQWDDWHYGRPRTAQYDAVVGHNGDAAANPSHFLALNLDRKIIVIEIPANDPAQARIYLGPTLVGDGQDVTPVTLSFEDRNGDGRPDLNIHIGDQVIVFLNNGKQFVAPQPH
jgi:hypothetical protein